MRLLARSLIVLFLFILFPFLFINFAFALTTPYRSAGTINTDGTVTFNNLSNCSATDGQTCDRSLATSQANLYFRNFGTYADFGMSTGSAITKVKIRVTGKTSDVFYAGLSLQMPATSNCQSPSDIWTGYLGTGAIAVKIFTTDVTQSGIHAVSASCLQQSNFENRMVWRLNYPSSPAWSANIDNFEIAFDYDPGPTPTPTLTPMPTLTPTPTPETPILIAAPTKTPLILIPGIGGSELKTTEMKVWADNNGHGGIFNYLYPANETVWLNEPKMGELGEDDYYDVLRMKIDGITSETNLEPNGNLVARAYQGTIDFFTSNGYILNQNLFVFPYDWRKDISGTKGLLDQEIQQVKTQTGFQKVDIVAHSMGGLVARNYISDPAKAVNVRKLFTLGTPHLGSVNFLKALRFGDCLAVEVGPFCLSLAPSELKDVVQNMVSSFELAPSKSYFNFYSGEDNQHPYPYKTEAGPLNYPQIKTLLNSLGHNTSLFTPSEIFRSIENNFSTTNGVDVTLIAGSGKNTLGQIIEEKNHKDIFYINGDGTVPLMSASLVDYDKSLVLLGDALVFYTNQKHGELVASGSALNLVNNILQGDDQLPEGVLTRPYSLPIGWLFSKHSPVDMSIYDSLGNHTGPTDDGFEENIPNSTYETLDDAAFIFIPGNGNYNIKFKATDQGSFDFRIRKFENESFSREILYKDIPLRTLSSAEAQFNTSSDQSPVVHLDKDGNGTFDEDFSPFTNQVSNPTVSPTPFLTSSPTPVHLASGATSAVSSILQEEAIVLPNRDVLGVQINSQKGNTSDSKFLDRNKKEKILIISLVIIFTGLGVSTYIKLRR